MSGIAPQTLVRLSAVGTATLTTVMFKRGLRNVFLNGPRRLSQGHNMVGPADTQRTIPSPEDLDRLEAFRDRTGPQRKVVEEYPAGAVFVVDSRGDARAASLGGIAADRRFDACGFCRVVA